MKLKVTDKINNSVSFNSVLLIVLLFTLTLLNQIASGEDIKISIKNFRSNNSSIHFLIRNSYINRTKNKPIVKYYSLKNNTEKNQFPINNEKQLPVNNEHVITSFNITNSSECHFAQGNGTLYYYGKTKILNLAVINRIKSSPARQIVRDLHKEQDYVVNQQYHYFVNHLDRLYLALRHLNNPDVVDVINGYRHDLEEIYSHYQLTKDFVQFREDIHVLLFNLNDFHLLVIEDIALVF